MTMMAMPDYAAYGLPEFLGVFSRHAQMAFYNFYQENGGNVVAVAGKDYALIASDTRLCSAEKLIHSREQRKLFRLSDQTVMGSCGCWCDVLAFATMMDARMKMYEHEHNKIMSTNAVAQLVSWSLYQKRAFPYAISNIVAGLDSEGKGCVFSFDIIGHLENEPFRAAGTASSLLQPLLDDQIGKQSLEEVQFVPITQEQATMIVKDVFVSAAERDIYTGDGVIFYTITRKAVTMEEFPLRRD